MILTPAQTTIAADTHRFRVANCGRRFGKTKLSVEELKGKLISRECNVAYIGPTLQQARDIVWGELKKQLQGALVYDNESRLEMKVQNVKGTTSTIYVRGWENIETLRGMQFDFLVIDEISSMRNWLGVWQEVIRPTLTDTKGEVLFISTPKGFNHFYDLFNEEHKDNDYKSFHFTSYDNPHIPTEEIDKARQELTEDRFAQEYLADFRKTEGLVYKEFDRAKHVFTDMGKIKQSIRHLIGVDWGFTNPAAILEIVEDADRNHYVVSEYYKPGKTTNELVDQAASLKGNAYYPDPAEPDRIEELRRRGLNVQEVNKEVIAGIDSVRSALKTNKLFIHASCKNTIQEFETYSYKEKRPDNNEPEEPIKENDHAMDALRYVIHMVGSVGIQQTAGIYRPKHFTPIQRKPTTQYA